MMKINENFVHEVLMVTMLLTHDCIKWSQPEYLQYHNPNYRQKIIPNILNNKSKQPDRWRHPRQQASRQWPSVTGWIWKISPVGRAEFIKRNQLRQNGDLACLDFVVNSSIFCHFEASLKPWIQLWLYYVQAGWIFLEPTCIHIYDIIFFSNRSIC